MPRGRAIRSPSGAGASAHDTASPVTVAQREEPDRRVDEFERFDAAGISWSDVLFRIRTRRT